MPRDGRSPSCSIPKTLPPRGPGSHLRTLLFLLLLLFLQLLLLLLLARPSFYALDRFFAPRSRRDKVHG